MASIVDLTHYKAVRGITNTERDAAVEAAIPAAEQAILEYTERDLTSDPATDTRSYPYEPNSVIVNIDDAVSITSVSMNERALTANQTFRAGKINGEPVFSFLELAPQAALADPLFEVTHVVTTSSFRPFQTVTVTGLFGWPSIPATATQAAVWLIDEMIAPGADTTGHAAEAIADLSYVNRGEEEQNPVAVLPPRVAQILNNLRKVSV